MDYTLVGFFQIQDIGALLRIPCRTIDSAIAFLKLRRSAI
jgi:hypothetical protein